MKEIQLTKGKVALVDDEDFDWLNQWSWCYNGKYAIRGFKINGKSHSVRMHRAIIDTPEGMLTDHVNGNKLDNRKENLRICSNSQNQCNRGVPQNSTSGYKGVTWAKNIRKWRAQININGNRRKLGSFDDVLDAARAYDKAAKENFGEFACVNGV